MILYFYIILAFISGILFVMSDKVVDMTIIWIDFAIFFIGGLNIVRDDILKKNYISFHILFLISFFFTTYCFPLFIYESPLDFRLYAGKYVNYDYLTPAVSLSTLSIAFYYIGVTLQRNRKKNHIISDLQINKNNLVLKIYWFFFTLLSINLVYFYKINGTDSINVSTNPFISQLYLVSLVFALLRSNNNEEKRNVWLYIKYNWKVLIGTLCIILFHLYIGDRGFPISALLVIITVYSYMYSRLKIKMLIALALTGVLLMFAIRVTRNTDSSIKDGSLSNTSSMVVEKMGGYSALIIFSDLYGANNELCLGYELYEKQGLVNPSEIFMIPFNAIPLLPTILYKIVYDITPSEASSGEILNQSLSGVIEASLGTHVVADILIKWGWLGCCAFFLLFGFVIGYFNTEKFKSRFHFIVFVLITAQAVYIARSSIFDIIRPIAYVFFLEWYIAKMTKRKFLKRAEFAGKC